MKSLMTNTREKSDDALIQKIRYVLDSLFSTTDCATIPQLAVIAIYQCLIQETKRFQGKSIWPLEEVFSSRIREQRILDFEVLSPDGKLFERVVVHHRVPITLNLLKVSENAFRTKSPDRVYLLSTIGTPAGKMSKITLEAERIKSAHGFEVIVDGVLPTIEYYLRILDNTQGFIECYMNLLENDKSVKFEHKQRWNELIRG